MVSVSVWPLQTAVAFWLLVVPKAVRSSPYLMKYTARSNSPYCDTTSNKTESLFLRGSVFFVCVGEKSVPRKVEEGLSPYLLQNDK